MTNINIYTHTCIYIYIHIYTYIYIHTCIHTYIHTYVYTYIYIYIYVCVCVCIFPHSQQPQNSIGWFVRQIGNRDYCPLLLSSPRPNAHGRFRPADLGRLGTGDHWTGGKVGRLNTGPPSEGEKKKRISIFLKKDIHPGASWIFQTCQAGKSTF